MCSIFGTSIRDLDKLQQLAIEGEVRGTDATGIATINDDKFTVYKQPERAKNIDYSKIEEGNFYLGHTRKTTQGNEGDNFNNHPFVSEDETLVFAHNGVFSNDKELKTKETKIETDSYYALQTIQKEKGDSSLDVNILKSACEKMSGSFALSIYDVTTNKLFLLRHSNPLWILYKQETGEIVYASLPEMIRNSYGKETDYQSFIGQIEENIIYEYDVKEGKFTNQIDFTAKKRTYTKSYGNTGRVYNYHKKTFNENTERFKLKYLKKTDFTTVRSTFGTSEYYKHETCDFCGIKYRDDYYRKAGITKEGKHFCAYCWEGEVAPTDVNSQSSLSSIKKAKKAREKIEEEEKALKEFNEGFSVDKMVLNEREFLELEKEEQEEYIFCANCKFYYKDAEDIMVFDEKNQTYKCNWCAESSNKKAGFIV
ncbi:MAG: class II glutamine amidotransferase [Nanoarchaeota archaeon]